MKGSDLGVEDGRLVLDFNFAYNPSCSYDPRWVCPLSPPANHLPLRIEAGERIPLEKPEAGLEPAAPTLQESTLCQLSYSGAAVIVAVALLSI